MTTATSYSDKNRGSYLRRHTLRTNMAFSIVSAIFMILIMPVVYFTAILPDLIWQLERGRIDNIIRQFEDGVFMAMGVGIGVQVFMMFMALVCALVTNAYMHSKSQTDFYHSLPVSRKSLLTTNMFSGCAALLIPVYAMAVIMMLIQIIGFGSLGVFGAYYVISTIRDLLGITMGVVMVFAFCTLINVNVGTAFDTFAVSMALGFAPLIIYFTIAGYFDSNMLGADMIVSEYATLISPFSYPLFRIAYMESVRAFWSEILFFIGGFAICAVLYLLCLFFYGRRKSEIAEQKQSGGVLKTAVKCIGAFFGGAIFCLIFMGNTGSALGTIFYTMLGAVMTGVVAELIMSRGARYLLKNAKWILGTGALTCLIFISIQYDWYGFETFVPNPNHVRSVSVSYGGRFNPNRGSWVNMHVNYTDDEIINIVTNSHTMALHEFALMSNSRSGEWRPVRITYTMNSGRRISRLYNNFPSDAFLHLAALEANEQFIRSTSPLFREWVDSAAHQYTRVSYRGMLNTGELWLDLTPQQIADLIEDLRTDSLGETLPELINPSAPALGWIDLEIINNQRSVAQAETISVMLTHEFTHTLNLLNALGYARFLELDDLIYDSMYLLIYHTFTSGGGAGITWPGNHTNSGREFRGPITSRWGITVIDEYNILTESKHGAAISVAPHLTTHLSANARDRRIDSSNDIWEGKIFYLLYTDEHENIIGSRFIRRENLPDELLQIVEALEENTRREEEQWHMSAGIPPTPAMPAAIQETHVEAIRVQH